MTNSDEAQRAALENAQRARAYDETHPAAMSDDQMRAELAAREERRRNEAKLRKEREQAAAEQKANDAKARRERIRNWYLTERKQEFTDASFNRNYETLEAEYDKALIEQAKKAKLASWHGPTL